MLLRAFTVCLGVMAFSLMAVAARDNVTCGIKQGWPLSNAYGPWDYTNPAHQEKLPIVIRAHFTSKVERLIDGETGELIRDIDYTLRAIPNFHRALYAMAKLQRREGVGSQVFDFSFYTADCYFERAIYFQPQDMVSYMLYGMHLHLTNRLDKALKKYQEALQLSPNYPELNYNVGLLYVDLGDKANAQKHADVAYEGGYPLDGLKNKIARMK